MKKNWIKNIKQEKWLLEEYKLLFQNYFHEDNAISRQHSFYTTVNGVLLTFNGTYMLGRNEISLYYIPIIGILISFSWILSSNRVRMIRNNILSRAYEIENILHNNWGKEYNFFPLDSKSFDSTDKYLNKNILSRIKLIINSFPSSYSNMILPISFLIIWTVLLVSNFVNEL